MNYTFVSKRQLSFIISVGGRNLLVPFGSRNDAGVAAFMTTDEKVARAIRRHSLSRRGIIEETTKPEAVVAAPPQHTVKKPAAGATGVVTGDGKNVDEMHGTKPQEGTGKPAGEAAGTVAEQREYDNYTVAREAICKEFGIKKGDVRNPAALEQVAKEHGITIIYKNANA